MKHRFIPELDMLIMLFSTEDSLAVLYEINVALKRRYISNVYKLLQQTSINFYPFSKVPLEEEGLKPN